MDKRIKLSESERKEITALYKQGNPISGIARHYNVSRRLIGFIVKPETYEKQKAITVRAFKARKALGISTRESKLASLEQARSKKLRLEKELHTLIVKIKGLENWLSIN